MSDIDDKLPRATLEQKIQVLDWFHKNGSKSQRYTVKYFQSLGEFAITKSTLNRWIKEENDLRLNSNLNINNHKIKTISNTRYKLVDDCLNKYYELNLFTNEFQLSEPNLIDKWLEFAKILYPNDVDLLNNKSNGWVYHFKRKNASKRQLILDFLNFEPLKQNVHGYYSLKFEKDSIMNKISSPLCSYKPNDVFQFDELVITSRILPNERVKMKFIVGIGLNSDCTEFLDPLIVSNTHRDSTVEEDLDKFYYQSNLNELTNEIFNDYMIKLDKSLGKRKILLLLDRLYQHVIPPLSNIEIYWFNSNNNSTFYSRLNETSTHKFDKTFEFQPLNLGIIKNFKIIFKTFLLKHIFNNQLNDTMNVIDFELMLQLINDTYKSLQNSKYNEDLLRCWDNSGILPYKVMKRSKQSLMNINNVIFDHKIKTMFWKLIKLLVGDVVYALDDLLFPPDEFVLNKQFTDHEIVAHVKLKTQGSGFKRQRQEQSQSQQQTQVTSNELITIDRLVNHDLKRFFDKNHDSLPESYIHFKKFLHSYINESVELHLTDPNDADSTIRMDPRIINSYNN